VRALTTLLAASLFTSSCGSPSNPLDESQLVKFEVDQGPVENGKHLKMTFTELQRRGAISDISIKFTSGGSISSIMVEVRGLCLIAQSRGAQQFWSVGETRTQGDEWLSTAEFSDAPDPHPESTSIDDCKLMGLLQ
jgi:hypothetical protein